MSISYKSIRSDRQWQSSTGLSKVQFFKLSELFGQMYEEIFGESLESEGRSFSTYADLLFFGLYSIKSGLTYDLLGLSFDLSTSSVYENQSVVLRVLESTLLQGGHLPLRAVENEEAFKVYLNEEPSILIDATEQRIQRPSKGEEQRQDYSGKKKPTQ